MLCSAYQNFTARFGAICVLRFFTKTAENSDQNCPRSNENNDAAALRST